MSSPQQFLAISRQKLLKAIGHLDYSYRKVNQLSLHLGELSEENLETWESFTTRFARVADIFLTRFLRAYVLNNDPGFQGSLRDFVNQGEKLGIIDNANAWMGIRELRNITAHEYTDEEIALFFERIRSETPRLLKIREIVNAIKP